MAVISTIMYIFRDRILWVDRSEVLLVVQVTVAVISLAETMLVQYLSYKVLGFLINTNAMVLSFLTAYN